jgi:hypothetical protein
MEALLAAAADAKRPAPPPPPWSWNDAAKATWRVYREVCEQARSGTRKLVVEPPQRPRMRRAPRARRESS